MLVNIKRLKIGDRIIALMAVFVMDVLIGFELSTKMLFHHVAMLKHAFSIDSDPAVSRFVFDALRRGVAVLRTKEFRKLPRRGYCECLSAMLAKLLDTSKVMGFFADDSFQPCRFSICPCRDGSTSPGAKSRSLFSIRAVFEDGSAPFTAFSMGHI